MRLPPIAMTLAAALICGCGNGCDRLRVLDNRHDFA